MFEDNNSKLYMNVCGPMKLPPGNSFLIYFSFFQPLPVPFLPCLIFAPFSAFWCNFDKPLFSFWVIKKERGQNYIARNLQHFTGGGGGVEQITWSDAQKDLVKLPVFPVFFFFHLSISCLAILSSFGRRLSFSFGNGDQMSSLIFIF